MSTHWPDGPFVSRSPSGKGVFGHLVQFPGAMRIELGCEEPFVNHGLYLDLRFRGVWEGTTERG